MWYPLWYFLVRFEIHWKLSYNIYHSLNSPILFNYYGTILRKGMNVKEKAVGSAYFSRQTLNLSIDWHHKETFYGGLGVEPISLLIISTKEMLFTFTMFWNSLYTSTVLNTTKSSNDGAIPTSIYHIEVKLEALVEYFLTILIRYWSAIHFQSLFCFMTWLQINIRNIANQHHRKPLIFYN